MLVISSYNGLNRTLYRVLSRKLTLVKNTSRRVVITQISDRLLLLVTIVAPTSGQSLHPPCIMQQWIPKNPNEPSGSTPTQIVKKAHPKRDSKHAVEAGRAQF